jgi:membrane-bound ClpP family serine protease
VSGVLDQPAVVLLCVTIAAVLFIIEAALPTLGIAGTAGVAVSIAAGIGIDRQNADWWPLVGPAAAMIVWAFLVVARRRSPILEVCAIGAFTAGGLGFAAANSDGATAALTVVGAAALAFAFPPLHRAATAPLSAPPQVGMEALVGMPAVVDHWDNGSGVVVLRGTRWNAIPDDSVAPRADPHSGDEVTVVGSRGNTLVISSPTIPHRSTS